MAEDAPLQPNVIQPAAPKRRGPGRPFVKGQSGNPGGKAKGVRARVRELIGEDGDQIWEMLRDVALARPGHAKASMRDRIEAARILTDRAFGRATETSIQVDMTAAEAQQALDVADAELLAIAAGDVKVIDSPAVRELDAGLDLEPEAETSTANAPDDASNVP